MALNPKFSAASRNAALDALTALLNNGYLRIYQGTQPADPDTALGSVTLLAELRLGATAFAGAANGSAAANAITQDSAADATGTAQFFRAFASNGSTAVHDGTCGTSGCNLNLASVAIQAGAPVSVSSFSITAG
jgi:hypothetical protein